MSKTTKTREDLPPLDRWRLDEVLDPEPRGKLWGLPQIAEALGVSVDTARKWSHIPAVPIYRPEGSGTCFAFRSELLAWMKTKKFEPDQ